MPRGHGLLRRPVNDRSWRDLTVKTGVNKRQVSGRSETIACDSASPALIGTGRQGKSRNLDFFVFR
jgi:hypothetical protein